MSHFPPAQRPEQHTAFEAQALPWPLHAPPLIDWHVPAHLPLQHCVFDAHAVVSPRHAVAWQILFAPQEPEQQSELFRHWVAEAVAMHGPAMLPHWFGA